MAIVHARIGHAKEDLRIGIGRVKKALKRVPREERGFYKDAIAKMEEARATLMLIKCIQQAMSFDIPTPYARPGPRRSGGAGKNGSGGSRKKK